LAWRTPHDSSLGAWLKVTPCSTGPYASHQRRPLVARSGSPVRRLGSQCLMKAEDKATTEIGQSDKIIHLKTEHESSRPECRTAWRLGDRRRRRAGIEAGELSVTLKTPTGGTRLPPVDRHIPPSNHKLLLRPSQTLCPSLGAAKASVVAGGGLSQR
jgi:hypothetical protein